MNTNTARSETAIDLCNAAAVWIDTYGPDKTGFLELAREVFDITADTEGHYTDPHWLYRLYDQDDRLLYVGITRNLADRITSHKRWLGDLLDYYETDEYPDRESVLAAEAWAIDTEHPAFNITHPRVK
jgi:hypothetical protein